MSTERKPQEESADAGNNSNQPSNADGRELSRNKGWDLIRQLNEKLKRPSFLLASKCADCNKWKQKRHGDIKRAESWHENTVKRREAGRKHWLVASGGARLAIE